MVYFFTSNGTTSELYIYWYYYIVVVKPPATIYMGRDKFENEELIKYAEAEDFWFHVDELSSAHVYLKLQEGWTLDSIPEPLLVDCAQLVKANSIEGNKKNNVRVIYTPASNLRKEASFDVGQVAFHSQKLVRRIDVERRVNETVNRLNKTKEERSIDYEAEQAARLAAEKRQRKQVLERQRVEDEQERQKKKEEAELKSYSRVFDDASMTSNKLSGPLDPRKYEEDFF